MITMSEPNLHQLEREVEGARAKLAADLAVLRSPDTFSEFTEGLKSETLGAKDALVERAKSSVQSTIEGFVEDLKGRAAANPSAAVAIGAGIAWRLFRHPPIATALIGAGLVSLFRDSDAALIALDLGVDTSTPEGSRVASTLVTINGWASGRIARRAATARAQLLERIATMHEEEGMSLQEIADDLNARGERTLSGADAWWPSGVQTALRYWRSTQPPVAELSLEERAAG